MKGLIIYKGKYGATQQYAGWLGAELKLPVRASHECSPEELAAAEYLVIGTSVYIGVLVIKEWLRVNAENLKGKPILLFVVCGTAPEEKVKLESYIDNSLSPQIRNQCTLYFLPGRMIYKKLSLADKLLLRIGSLLNRKKGENKSILEGYDAVKKENIGPLVREASLLANSKPNLVV